jgi:hypothetical protein
MSRSSRRHAYLRPSVYAADESALATSQNRYQLGQDLLFSAYRVGISAPAADLAAAHAAVPGPSGIEGDCEALGQDGVLPMFRRLDRPRFPRSLPHRDWPPRNDGAGQRVAATACGLFAARYGPTTIVGAPRCRQATAMESVPSATLTPLVELGVVPRELDLPRLIRGRTVT